MTQNAISAKRILFLSQDPTCIAAQLSGTSTSLQTAERLRDDVSTDEITPTTVMVHFDERLGQFPYVGLQCAGVKPIKKNDVANAGFNIVVAGDRYGKGSSREHSPAAELHAGIQLVIARSFERLYRQNADNIGLLTSTDMGLIGRLQAGESITLDELLQDREPLAAQIVRAGGLLAWGAQHLHHQSDRSPSKPTSEPQTLVQKIITRHLLGTHATSNSMEQGQGVFVRADWRFIHEYYTGMAASKLKRTFGKHLAMHQPASILLFEDHLSYVAQSPAHVSQGLVGAVGQLSQAHRQFATEFALKNHGYLDETSQDSGSQGISHAMMAERYALPGQLIVGTDSHTPHSGALGCLAFGIGTTDMANAFATGAVRLTMPASIKVVLNSALPVGISAKDVVLHMLSLPAIKAGVGLGKVFEFTGDALRAMDIDERTTLTNMTAELGGLTGIVAPDALTLAFIQTRRGLDITLEDWMHSDDGATYAETISVDCTALRPMLAAPGDPGNGLRVADLTQPINIQIAYGGSCTAGKRADFDQYHAVLAWAFSRGLTVPKDVALYLQFGTVDVRDYCEHQGYLATFVAVGARFLQPACGACANCGPGSSEASNAVTISAINRNFPGRSGPDQVWLASPATVAASAIAGRILDFAGLQALHQ